MDFFKGLMDAIAKQASGQQAQDLEREAAEKAREMGERAKREVERAREIRKQATEERERARQAREQSRRSKGWSSTNSSSRQGWSSTNSGSYQGWSSTDNGSFKMWSSVDFSPLKTGPSPDFDIHKMPRANGYHEGMEIKANGITVALRDGDIYLEKQLVDFKGQDHVVVPTRDGRRVSFTRKGDGSVLVNMAGYKTTLFPHRKRDW